MYIAPKAISPPKAPELQYWPSIPTMLNGGLNLVDKEWKLPDSQTSKALNVWWYQGELGKRWGQEYVNADVGNPILSAYEYEYDGKIMYHAGTKIYEVVTETGVTTEKYSGVAAIKGSFFRFNGKIHFIQPGKFLVYDSTITDVVPYVPTVIINRTYSGGGDIVEQYNRLGAGFINAFITDNSHTVFPLTDTNLDATALVGTSDGGATWSLVEGVDFTVDRVTGLVTYTSTPPSAQNLYRIKSFKTDSAAINSILNCKESENFGGQNDNRVFFGGNGTGYYYWTGITTAGPDVSYWPYNNYNIVGDTDEDIRKFGEQYNTLCIFKDRSIHGVTYTWDGTKGIFNTYTISPAIGCDCPDTVKVINNQLTWLTTYKGPCTLVGTDVENQKNVMPIGRNINPRLLAESNLSNANAADYGGKYWLCVNDKVYLWDYTISPYSYSGNPDEDAKRLSWWYFDNINASCWIVGDSLYYGRRDNGRIVKFHEAYDNQQFYDFGEGFNALYRWSFKEMGGGVYEFTVSRGYIGVRGDAKTSYTVTYFSSDDWNGDPSTEQIDVGSFSWANFSWAAFTWAVMGPKFDVVVQPGAKNVRYFGAEFSNNDPGKDMNISSITWEYKLSKFIK